MFNRWTWQTPGRGLGEAFALPAVCAGLSQGGWYLSPVLQPGPSLALR